MSSLSSKFKVQNHIQTLEEGSLIAPQNHMGTGSTKKAKKAEPSHYRTTYTSLVRRPETSSGRAAASPKSYCTKDLAAGKELNQETDR
jgi:hypothetical protein